MNVYEPVFDDYDEANGIYLECASRYPSYHWPKALTPEMYDRSIYNCILCELRDDEGGFIVVCADIMGMIGHGDTADEAITDLRCGVKCRLCEGDGGVYVGTSDYAFQESELLKFEDSLAIDDVYIVHKTYIQLAVVEEYPRYCD
jgi:hypothetical protein